MTEPTPEGLTGERWRSLTAARCVPSTGDRGITVDHEEHSSSLELVVYDGDAASRRLGALWNAVSASLGVGVRVRGRWMMAGA